MISRCGGFGIKLIQQRSQFPARGRVGRFYKLFKDGRFCVVNLFRRTRRHRVSTVGTPIMVGRERFPTVPTRFSNLVGSVVAFDNPRLSKNILRVFGRRNVFVGLPHVGVQRPMHAMLDLGPTVSLADHSRNRRVAEGVRFNVGVQVGPVSDSTELLTDSVRVNAPVVTPSTVARPRGRLYLVEQRHVRVVRSGMRRSQIGANRPLGVDQRVLRNRRTLQPHRVGVRRVRRRVRQIHVANAERQGKREARASVREEFDERYVSLMPRRFRQCLDIRRGEHVVGTHRIFVAGRSVDGFGPLCAGHVLAVHEDGRLVGTNRAIGQAMVVAEFEDEIVKVAFIKFDDRNLRPLARKTDAPQIDFQTRDFDSAGLLPEPLIDRLSVGLMYGRTVRKTLAFIFEALAELLRVVSRHTPTTVYSYYKLPIRESTCSISYEIAEQRPDQTISSPPQQPSVTAAGAGASEGVPA